MSINQGSNNTAYGIQNGVQFLPPQMIFALRAPTVLDYAPFGTWWIDTAANAYYILTSKQHWTAQQSGSDTQATLILNGVAGTVLSVLTGNTVLGGDLEVDGITDLTGDTFVTGSFEATGSSFTVTSPGKILLTSTDNEVG